MASAAVRLRAVLNKAAKTWASCRGNHHHRRLVNGKFSSVLGGVDSSSHFHSSHNNVDVWPASFDFPASRKHYCSLQSTELSDRLTPVSCANDDRGVLYAADYAINIYNEHFASTGKVISSRVVKASALRIGICIYSLILEGIPETGGSLNVYHALVQHNPFKQEKTLLDWQLVSESSFPCPRCLDSVDCQGVDMRGETKNYTHSTVASDAIVPIDAEDNEQINNYTLYDYASSAVIENNYNLVNKKIRLEKVLCASKLEVAGAVSYFLFFRAKDVDADRGIFCAVIKKDGVEEFSSMSPQQYQVGTRKMQDSILHVVRVGSA
ncbi:OLC1v1015460C3 [Oldenlandia corymbosa var. corymbosa]|uniref:OLC1v1015460C3 n=1 Tax=Oldenlandia corymbosa var. corymbosa TaxID=529605 RepID=A0AAV1E3C8_OLDCO|nr:OLC1v1015460C3 [Oldenlandia corymbosa var. corymbosa]